MATQRIEIPGELFSQLEAKAEAEGRSVDDLAAATLRESLRGKEWQSRLARGLEYGQKSGIREDEVVDTVREWRNENRLR